MRTSILRLIVFFLAFAAPALASSPELTTQGLEQRVDFWKKVYTQYGKDDLIIHDRTHVSLIYAVASDENVNAKISAIRSALNELRANLDMPENFSSAAQEIYAAMLNQNIPATP